MTTQTSRSWGICAIALALMAGSVSQSQQKCTYDPTTKSPCCAEESACGQAQSEHCPILSQVPVVGQLFRGKKTIQIKLAPCAESACCSEQKPCCKVKKDCCPIATKLSQLRKSVKLKKSKPNAWYTVTGCATQVTKPCCVKTKPVQTCPIADPFCGTTTIQAKSCCDGKCCQCGDKCKCSGESKQKVYVIKTSQPQVPTVKVIVQVVPHAVDVVTVPALPPAPAPVFVPFHGPRWAHPHAVQVPHQHVHHGILPPPRKPRQMKTVPVKKVKETKKKVSRCPLEQGMFKAVWDWCAPTEVWVPGCTLPSPHYLQHAPQHCPPSPPFAFERGPASCLPCPAPQVVPTSYVQPKKVPLTSTLEAENVTIQSENFRVVGKRLSMSNDGTVVVQGNVQVQCKMKNGQRIEMRAERVRLNMQKGTFALEGNRNVNYAK